MANGLHKIKFVTENRLTHIWLDDMEVQGCVGAVFGYEIDALPIVKLLLHASEIEVDSDAAEVEKKDLNQITEEMKGEKAHE